MPRNRLPGPTQAKTASRVEAFLAVHAPTVPAGMDSFSAPDPAPQVPHLPASNSAMDTINLIGKLADLKDSHYRNTLALSAVIDLLIEKGILTAQEIATRAARLDADSHG